MTGSRRDARPSFFAPFLNDLLDFVLYAMVPLSVRGDGSGASSSKRPQLDLVPAAEPESAPPSDPRAVEDEKNRLRQENAELQRRRSFVMGSQLYYYCPSLSFIVKVPIRLRLSVSLSLDLG